MAGSMMVCLLSLFRSKKPFAVRLMPLMFLGSFAGLYNYQIGQYGVYKNLDKITTLMTSKPETEVSRLTQEYLIANDPYKKYKAISENATAEEVV